MGIVRSVMTPRGAGGAAVPPRFSLSPMPCHARDEAR
jgi:hypothetical protein